MKDWLVFLLAVSPLLALGVGAIAITTDWYFVGTFALGYAATSSFGCLGLLRDFAAHGIHNDR